MQSRWELGGSGACGAFGYLPAASLRQLFPLTTCCSPCPRTPRTNTFALSAPCQCFLQYDDIVAMLGDDFSGTVFLPNNAVSGAGGVACCTKAAGMLPQAVHRRCPCKNGSGLGATAAGSSDAFLRVRESYSRLLSPVCAPARPMSHETTGVCRRHVGCRSRWPDPEPGADQQNPCEWHNAAGWVLPAFNASAEACAVPPPASPRAPPFLCCCQAHVPSCLGACRPLCPAQKAHVVPINVVPASKLVDGQELATLLPDSPLAVS